MIPFGQHPIQNIQWLDVDQLVPNDWNPNRVLAPEMKLIKLSLMTQGWIQPVLVNRERSCQPGCRAGEEGVEGKCSATCGEFHYEIIDGFHRSTLCKTDKDVRAMTEGRVPAAVLNLTVPERMMLTVRINRAKGTHQASLMHDLVKALIVEHEVPKAVLAKAIGATTHEIDTLMLDDVFKKLDVENVPYSRAWRPRMKGE